MKNRAWLVEKYGEGTADSIIENKRQMQLKRKSTDPQYVMDNPDIPGSKETFLEIGWIQTFLICLQSQKIIAPEPPPTCDLLYLHPFFTMH